MSEHCFDQIGNESDGGRGDNKWVNGRLKTPSVQWR
jgi:hypothetical protein